MQGVSVGRRGRPLRSRPRPRCGYVRPLCARTYAARTPDKVLEDRARLHPGGLKQCRKCGLDLPFTAFATSRYKADGLDTDCRACIAARNGKTREVDQGSRGK